ncbi:MAG: hypothetical protein GTO63_33525, partial [Anaerolineae bacterium]|nr:hypothetical protein [Anaerolineae bacterium]NIQ82420.1 hypothetical protein [Anaerolineae bacterium]
IEPRVTTAVQKGIGRVLEENPRFKHILQPFPVTANCVSTRFLSQNQRATAAVYRALARAARDIREDEAAARQFLPKYTPLDPSLAAECHLYYWWQPADVDYEAVQRLADLFRGQGLLKKKIDTEAMFVHFE